MRTSARAVAIAAAAIVLMIAGGWWGVSTWAADWAPDRARWPVQGVAIGDDNMPVDWAALSRQGIGFVYIDATDGSADASSRFTALYDDAVAAGLRVGAIHRFDMCALASEQSAAFVTLVPRDADALPPAVTIDTTERCQRRPTKALLITELTTFLTQLETHMGKIALVGPAPDVEDEFGVMAAVSHPLWLRSNRAEPGPDQPDWVIWQANDTATIDGLSGQARRLVANDGAFVTGSAP